MVVVFQEPAEPFAALHHVGTLAGLAGRRKEENIPFPLMIALMMEVCHILRTDIAQGTLSKQDDTGETLLLDRADPALGVGIQVWRPWGEWHALDARNIDDLLQGGTEFCVPILDQILAG